MPISAILKRLLILALLASSAHAEGSGHKLYRWSVAALVAGNAADVAGSWGRRELNPALGRGNFGAQQIAIKSGVVAGALVIQHFVVKYKPETERAIVVGNFVAAGVFGGVAVQSWSAR